MKTNGTSTNDNGKSGPAFRWPCADPECNDLAMSGERYCEDHFAIAMDHAVPVPPSVFQIGRKSGRNTVKQVV